MKEKFRRYIKEKSKLKRIGGVFLYQIQNSSHEILTRTINTPYGARTNFDLPDGSKILLNSG